MPPRPSNTLRPSLPRTIHTASRPTLFTRGNICAASRRHVATSSARSTTLFSTLFKRTLTRAIRALRSTLTRPQAVKLHPLLTAFKATIRNGTSYNVRSGLLKGAIDAFHGTASRTTPQATKTAYARLNTPSISFARGALSGFGPRPSAGQLSLSPLRGGVGLQTSRKFSSGSARVFDNLIVNAPLALRLAGDELEDKSKLLRKPKASIRRATPTSARRTGTRFTSAKLPQNALSFATNHCRQAIPQETTKVVEEQSDCGVESEYSEYFHYPSLPLCSTTFNSSSTGATVIRIRLINPLYDALGGRDPSPSTYAYGPRLFDTAFMLDAATALEFV
ncbi:hypothetical protein NDA16_005159 [Ustilago loliicola]|nr:hypothetical protein NDA16_005159 [Ustilago loliicola]